MAADEIASILIVNDRPEQLTALAAVVADLGQHVVTAASGREALRRLLHQDFAVILLDVQMPGMDGFETAALLRQRKRSSHTPIIFVTAYSADESHVSKGYALGAVDYIFTPIVPDILRAKVVVFVELYKKTEEVTRQLAERRRVEEQLANSNSELVALTEKLEERVTQRTAELEAIKAELEQRVAELKAVQSKIIQQERLRALGQMASGIAHDLNNALSPVVGFAELLLSVPENLADPTRARRYLDLIHTGASDAAHVVRRLREFYRQSESEKTLAPVDPEQLAVQVIALTEPRWKAQALAKGVHIEMRSEVRGLPPLPCNESAIREVLMNLILNAVDAMPEGGTLSLRGFAEADNLLLEVSDTGLGMPEEVKRRCFEPFFTTKGAHGTGLGLAMVYGIVQRHKGSIEVESTVGEGTTFRLRLPLLQASSGERDPEAFPQSAAPSRILVVDDEPLVREYLRECLSQDGHMVRLATNGPEGLESFRTESFDLVITDLAMPGMSGDQLAAAIKATSPETPVVLLSGFGDLIQASGEAPSGVDVVVGKPVESGALRRALAQAVAGRRQA